MTFMSFWFMTGKDRKSIQNLYYHDLNCLLPHRPDSIAFLPPLHPHSFRVSFTFKRSDRFRQDYFLTTFSNCCARKNTNTFYTKTY